MPLSRHNAAFCILIPLVYCFLSSDLLFSCSCLELLPVEKEFKRSDLVFVGVAKFVKILEQQSFENELHVDLNLYSFELTGLFKGEEALVAQVATPAENSACGFDFVEGDLYLVYCVYINSNLLITNICMRTKRIASAADGLSSEIKNEIELLEKLKKAQDK